MCIRDSFLQHALLVPENDFRRAMHDELLQAVVAVDDAAIQVVQVRRREAAAVERHESTQVRRYDWNDDKNHPLRASADFACLAKVGKRVQDLEPHKQHLLTM